MNNTYIYLWRSIMETSFYKNPKLTHFAVHVMLKAYWKEQTINLAGKSHILKRGQFVTGRYKLSEETGLSPQEIRTCIRTLEKDGFLTIKSTNKYSIITVLNYEKFQDSPNGDQPGNQPAINQQSTSNQPLKNTGNKDSMEKTEGQKPPRGKKQKEKTDNPPANAPNPDRPFDFTRPTTIPDNFHATPDMVKYADDIGYLGDPNELCQRIKYWCEANNKKKTKYHATFRQWLLSDKEKKPKLFREITEFAKMPPGFVYKPPDVEMDERCFD